MLGIVILAALVLVGWGFFQYVNAARQGRGAEWRAAFGRAWRGQKRRRR